MNFYRYRIQKQYFRPYNNEWLLFSGRKIFFLQNRYESLLFSKKQLQIIMFFLEKVTGHYFCVRKSYIYIITCLNEKVQNYYFFLRKSDDLQLLINGLRIFG